MKWLRVSKQHPCSVCSRFDWDTYCPELGLACCMRVVSNRPARNGGYLHPLGETVPRRTLPEPNTRVPTINATAMLRSWMRASDRPLSSLAQELGLEDWPLDTLSACWAPPHHAWCFPMSDAYGSCVGLRLRTDDGRKFAVKGSRQGIFMPRISPQETVWITEGPTDAAAGVQIGLFTLGRPSCRGCINDMVTAIRRADSRRAVILSDNDTPGYDGSVQLAQALHIPSVILCPPSKDLRAYVQAGGDAATLAAILTGQLWKQPEK